MSSIPHLSNSSFPTGLSESKRKRRSYRPEHVPAPWKWRFGESRALRYLGAFIGGFLVLCGARLAGGCTSGHGISGGPQFNVSSWIFFPSFFAAGIVTAFVLFGKEGRRHVQD